MKIITDLKEANTILEKYIGASLQVCMFDISLKRLALKLKLLNVNEVIYIVGVSCEYIKGYFNLRNTNLIITVEVDKETNEKATIIKDKNDGFELVTSGGFSLAQGLEEDFGESFEDFIINKT